VHVHVCFIAFGAKVYVGTYLPPFLANVHVRYNAVARPSVVCLSSVCRLSSVTLVHPTQAVQIFGNISTAFGTLAIR